MSHADLERAWEHYGKRGVPWCVWKAQQLNQFWTRNDPRVSTPNFRPETVLHGEKK